VGYVWWGIIRQNKSEPFNHLNGGGAHGKISLIFKWYHMHVESCLEHSYLENFDFGELCELMWRCVLDVFAWRYLYTWDDVVDLRIMWWPIDDVMFIRLLLTYDVMIEIR